MRCAPLVASGVALPLEDEGVESRAVVPLSFATALVSVRTASASTTYVVASDGTVAFEGTAAAGLDLTTFAIRGDELWAGAFDGSLYVGPAAIGSGPYESVGRAMEPLTRIATSPADEPREAFLFGSEFHTGRFYRYDGNTLTTPWGPPIPRNVQFLEDTAILWRGPGSADFVPFNGSCNTTLRCLVRFANDLAREEPLTLGPDEGPSTLARIDGIGEVVGTSQGSFLVRDGDGWSVLPGSPLAIDARSKIVRRILAYDGGFLGIGDRRVVQYLRGVGFCDAPLLYATEFVRVWDAATVGQDVIVVGAPGPSGGAAINVLRR